MSPEEKARLIIDKDPEGSGRVIQDRKDMKIHASPGAAVRKFPSGTGEVGHALFTPEATVRDHNKIRGNILKRKAAETNG